MTFLGIIGSPRTGKTLLATIIAVQIHRQNKLNNKPFYLFANYHFLDEMEKVSTYIDKPQTYMNVQTPELGQGLAIFDEMWAWAMARGSGSSIVGKFMQQVIFQSGKRGFDIMWTAQRSKSVDPNVRSQTYKFFKTRIPSEDYYRYNYVSSTYYDGKRVMPLRIMKSVANAYYKYYDTREIIKTLNPEDLEDSPTNTPTEISILTNIAEVDDNLTTQDQAEIQVIEERLAQQNQEEKQTEREILQQTPKKKTILMDLGLTKK